MTETLAEPGDLFPASVGEQLARARAERGLDLTDIADRTRIPLRHLRAIEEGRFDALPSPTYAMGFVRAYARTLGLDEVALAAQVREEMNLPPDPGGKHVRKSDVPPPEANRIPPAAYGWTAAVLFVLFVGGYLLLRSGDGFQVPLTGPPAAPAPVALAPAAPPEPTGAVVLTATDEVWLRVRDGAGETLVSRTLRPGESFAVPAAAAAPVATVGRPEALRVTVGGRAVPPLGPAGRPVNDVPLTPAALTARPGA